MLHMKDPNQDKFLKLPPSGVPLTGASLTPTVLPQRNVNTRGADWRKFRTGQL